MKRILAFMMIFLIVTLPVYSMTGIRTYRVTGQDNVNNVVQESDHYDVETFVSIDDEVILPRQVFFGTKTFDSCEPGINGYVCYYNSADKSFGMETPYSIYLFEQSRLKEDNSLPDLMWTVGEVHGKVIRDNMPPRLNIVTSALRTNENIQIDFQGFDDSYQLNKYNFCAGFKEIIFGTEFGFMSKRYEYDENVCQVSENFEIDIGVIPDGYYTLLVKAIDHVGNSQDYSLDFDVDRLGPSFASFGWHGENFVSTRFQEAKITIEVEDDAVLNSVVGDFSLFNDKAAYSSLKGNCQEASNIVCEWNIQVAPTAIGPKIIRFTAKDDLGNVNTQSYSVLLEKDVEGPRAYKLATQTVRNNINYIGPSDNTISVWFTESGAGLNKEDVLLDLRQLGGNSALPATRCDPGWICHWEDLSFTRSDKAYDISINSNTKDRLDNSLKEPFTAQVVMDTTAPKKIRTHVKILKGGPIDYEGVATFGDKFEIKVELDEPGVMFDAYGDFSAVVTDAYLVPAWNCEQGNQTWNCTFVTDAIDKTGYVDDFVRMTFVDTLGNSNEIKERLKVYSIEETEADYWEHDVECSPSKIDKRAAELFDQKIVCHVLLKGDAETIGIELDDCVTDSPYHGRQELMNGHPGSTDPYIKFTLRSIKSKNESFKAVCPMYIQSKVGRAVNKLPELENITIDVPFYKSNFGLPGENAQKKAEDAYEDATQGIWETISKINEWISYAERICSLITLVNTVAATINGIGMIFRNIGQGSAGVMSSMELKGQEKQSFSQKINAKMKEKYIIPDKGFINKFCKFISCRLFIDEWADGIFGKDTAKDLGDAQRWSSNFWNDWATGGTNFDTAYSTSSEEERGGIFGNKLQSGGKLNPKDSIVISVMTLCLPGIVHNLHKYRQILCLYSLCMTTAVQTGVPFDECEHAKEHATCKYVVGEVFQWIPFAGLLNYYANVIRNIFASPYGIVNLVMGYVCTQPIRTVGQQGMAFWCLVNDVLGMIGDIWQDLANFKESWELKRDLCEEMKDPEDLKEDEKDEG